MWWCSPLWIHLYCTTAANPNTMNKADSWDHGRSSCNITEVVENPRAITRSTLAQVKIITAFLHCCSPSALICQSFLITRSLHHLISNHYGLCCHVFLCFLSPSVTCAPIFCLKKKNPSKAHLNWQCFITFDLFGLICNQILLFVWISD